MLYQRTTEQSVHFYYMYFLLLENWNISLLFFHKTIVVMNAFFLPAALFFPLVSYLC